MCVFLNKHVYRDQNYVKYQTCWVQPSNRSYCHGGRSRSRVGRHLEPPSCYGSRGGLFFSSFSFHYCPTRCFFFVFLFSLVSLLCLKSLNKSCYHKKLAVAFLPIAGCPAPVWFSLSLERSGIAATKKKPIDQGQKWPF